MVSADLERATNAQGDIGRDDALSFDLDLCFCQMVIHVEKMFLLIGIEDCHQMPPVEAVAVNRRFAPTGE